MRCAACQFLIALLLFSPSLRAAEPRVIKVLPHLLDLEGRHSLSPSLFERDLYQDWLRSHPDQQSGIRYDVQWRPAKAGDFVLKLELLGRVAEGQARRQTVQTRVTTKRSGSQWSAVKFAGEEFKQFGPVVAWRLSLWQNDQLVAKQQSFLWE